MNAREEFENHIDKLSRVKCAIIKEEDFYCFDKKEYIHPVKAKLESGYSEDQYQDFLKKLNFEYDSGYGGQELFGYIWYEDGTWSSRGEYDGSEWWDHNMCPDESKEMGDS